MNWGGEGAKEAGEEAPAEAEQQEGPNSATAAGLHSDQLLLLYKDAGLNLWNRAESGKSLGSGPAHSPPQQPGLWKVAWSV